MSQDFPSYMKRTLCACLTDISTTSSCITIDWRRSICTAFDASWFHHGARISSCRSTYCDSWSVVNKPTAPSYPKLLPEDLFNSSAGILIAWHQVASSIRPNFLSGVTQLCLLHLRFHWFCVVLVSIPLPWQLEGKYCFVVTSHLSYMVWTGLGYLNGFIDLKVWNKKCCKFSAGLVRYM